MSDDDFEYDDEPDDDQDDSDDDVGFADAPPIQRAETSFTPLDQEACRAMANSRVDEVAELLCIDRTVAGMLLRQFTWDQEKLMEGAPLCLHPALRHTHSTRPVPVWSHVPVVRHGVHAAPSPAPRTLAGPAHALWADGSPLHRPDRSRTPPPPRVAQSTFSTPRARSRRSVRRSLGRPTSRSSTRARRCSSAVSRRRGHPCRSSAATVRGQLSNARNAPRHHLRTDPACPP